MPAAQMGHHGGSWGLPARGTAGPGAATPTFRRRPSPQSDAAPADHARPALSCRLTPEPSTALRPRTHRLRAPSRGREGSGPAGSYPEGLTADAPCSVGGSPSGLRGGVLAGPPCAAHRPNEASPPCPGAHGEDINQAGTRGGGSGGSGVGAAACHLAMKGPVLLALLGLCVTLAAGRRSSVVKDFDFDKVGSSGRPPWGGLLPDMPGSPPGLEPPGRSGRLSARGGGVPDPGARACSRSRPPSSQASGTRSPLPPSSTSRRRGRWWPCWWSGKAATWP